MLRSRPLARVRIRGWRAASLAVSLLVALLAAVPGRVNAQDAPDLAILRLSLSAPATRGGDVVTALVTVRNHGRAPADGFSVGVHFAGRRDAPLDGTTALGQIMVGPLAAGASVQRSLEFRVPVVAPGAFYVIAQADATGVVAETSDSNNRRAAGLHVVLPDLVVDSLLVRPSVAAAGDTVTVQARVRNLGRVPARATEGALHFATSPTSLDGETLRSTFRVPELAAGASEPLSLSFVVPPVAPGSFYVVARADGADDLEERSKSNNQRFTVLRVATADLSISRFTAAPPTVAVAGTIHGVVSLQNRAPVSSHPTTANLYIAASPDVDLATLLPTATTSVPAIGPRARTMLDIPATVPSLSHGTQYLIVQIGPGSPGPSALAARESLAAASAAAPAGPRGSTRFTVSLPDLTVSALSLSSTQVRAGATMTTVVTVRNAGSTLSAASLSALLMGACAGPGGHTVQTVPVPPLQPGESSTQTVASVVPPIDPGSYCLTARADSAATVVETVETNNERSVPFSIQGETPPLPSGVLTEYADPSQLDVPWEMHSHYKQPWRAWVETVPGQVLRNGIGINYNWHLLRQSQDVSMRLLADAGFTRIRIELNWGHVIDYDSLALTAPEQAKLTAIVTAAKRYGIRPLILVNAYHGVPVPHRTLERSVAVNAPAGSRTVVLNDVSGIVIGRTGLSNLTEDKMAEVLVTAVNVATRTVTLSRPLPVALHAGEPVTLNTLKYLPLFEPGMPQFEETLQGWLAYVRAVCRAVTAAGVSDFDVEIWNELTFGADFLSINRYYNPPLIAQDPGDEGLRAGGRSWELARRTVDMLGAEFPSVVPIWGFSNTTFFGTSVTKLPPRTGGQTYHPYFMIDYRSRADEQYGLEGNYERYAPPAPPYRALLPEGAATFLVTESLMRLTNPSARLARPPQSASFQHVLTEFGFHPGWQGGVTDPVEAELLKAKVLLRSAFLYLNKGLSALWFFTDIGGEGALGWDLVPESVASLGTYPAAPASHMSPAMRALKNASSLFRNASPLTARRTLGIETGAIDGGGIVFPGDATHPALTYQDVLAVLPFQTGDRAFVLALYVMSRNILQEIPTTTFTVRIANVDGTSAQVDYLDPMTGATVPVDVVERTSDSLTVVLGVADYPYLLQVRD